MSHAASASCVSPFEEAAILTVDGVGEWATASLRRGPRQRHQLFKEIRFPHCLGLLYSAFTYYLGFKVNSAEYKVMGLAPYGKPVHFDRIMKEMIHLNEDGSFKLDMKYFSYDYGLTHDERRLRRVLRRPAAQARDAGWPSASSTSRPPCRRSARRSCCAMVRYIHKETGLDEPLHGRRASPSTAWPTGASIRETPMKNLFVQPAAGDAGGAVGVAHYLYNTHREEAARAGPGPTPTSAPSTRTTRSGPYLDGARRASTTRCRARSSLQRTARLLCRRATWSAGSRGAWSSARAPWAAAASWPTRATRRCATPST